MTEADWKLRAPPETPADELCSCAPAAPWKLMPALGHNPVHCVACNLEVPPERLGLSSTLVDELVNWHDIYKAFDLLWLDSKEYEQLGAQQLADLNSPVNRRGLQLRQKLSEFSTIFYWVWRDVNEKAPDACPICAGQLESKWTTVVPQKICEECKLVMAA